MITNDIYIEGYKFSAAAAGIKHPDSDRIDLGLIVADRPAITAGVTTRNIVHAAPVAITRELLGKGKCSAILANSGNANACAGTRGMESARETINATAERLGIDPGLIAPMSTGVIGQPLPADRIIRAVPGLVDGLAPGKAELFARAIMTTDTVPKTSVLEGTVSSGPFKMVGFTKGSGMIAPNMATMLGVILIDMDLELDFLRDILPEAVAETFNTVTIDGDTSTNDTVIAMAAGRGGATPFGRDRSERETFLFTLKKLCMDLARQIVLDGEGATKLAEIVVYGARTKADATRVARTIAESPLVKTAFFGQDPNWGRIIAAAGRAGVDFDPDKVDLFIGDTPVMKNGALASEDWEEPAAKIMKRREFSVQIDLKSGTEKAVILTTDLSDGYIRINADYRS